jgi:hypothetical protein
MLALLTFRIGPLFWLFVVTFNLVGAVDIIVDYYTAASSVFRRWRENWAPPTRSRSSTCPADDHACGRILFAGASPNALGRGFIFIADAEIQPLAAIPIWLRNSSPSKLNTSSATLQMATISGCRYRWLRVAALNRTRVRAERSATEPDFAAGERNSPGEIQVETP